MLQRPAVAHARYRIPTTLGRPVAMRDGVRLSSTDAYLPDAPGPFTVI